MDAEHNSHLDPIKILALVLIAVIVAFAGGVLCGWIMAEQHKMVGAMLLWPLGVVAGYFGRKVVDGPNRTAGLILCGGCVVACLVADVAWIRWGTFEGEPGWATAIRLLPTFIRDKWLIALVTAMFTLAGILSIRQQFAR